MVQQIVLNFDSTGFEGFETVNSWFAHCTRTLKNRQRLRDALVKRLQGVVAC